jgi:protein-disulfide isomerase
VLEQYPDDVKVVFKNFPLTRIHKFALNASVAALAANQQGKFWEYHSELFKNYNKLNDEKFDEIAGSLGLDLEQFKKESDNFFSTSLLVRIKREGG